MGLNGFIICHRVREHGVIAQAVKPNCGSQPNLAAQKVTCDQSTAGLILNIRDDLPNQLEPSA
jgi:hypothetical protein